MKPKVRLSRLRDIGWKHWDPIGLLAAEGPNSVDWSDDNARGFADEYDGYLLQAAYQLRQGAARKAVVDYLTEIEVDRMGLGLGATTVQRANATVDAILADRSIWVRADHEDPDP